MRGVTSPQGQEVQSIGPTLSGAERPVPPRTNVSWERLSPGEREKSQTGTPSRGAEVGVWTAKRGDQEDRERCNGDKGPRAP